MAEDKDLNKLNSQAKEAGKAQAKAANEQQKAQKKIAETVKDIADASKGLLDIENDLFDASKKLSGVQLKRLQLQRDILKDQLSSLQTDKSQLISSSKNFKQIQQTAKVAKKIAELEAEALPHRKKLITSQKELNSFQDKYKNSVDESLGFLDKFDKEIKSIPIVGDFVSKTLGLDNIKEELGDKIGNVLNNTFKKSAVESKSAAESALSGYDSQIERLKGVGDAASDVTGMVGDIGPSAMGGAEGIAGIEGGLTAATPAAGGLMAALGPILPIALAIGAAVMLFKKALEIDQEVTDLARNMGQTKHEAEETHHHMLDIAQDTKVIGANAHALTKANQELNAVLGTNVDASKEMLEAQVLLTKQYGMSGEEAAAFQTVSAGTNKSAYQQLAAVESMVEGYNTMTGDSVNFKEITKDIAKSSKATLASYKGDVKALTLAAVQAKKMGMSLEDAAHVSEKLLDVESSLEAEMKANVLTGKHMNMNKARQLAFEGDIAGAAAEAVKQAGSYDDLLKMKPTQLKAVADAAGMEVDQLLKAGELQKMSIALGGQEIKDMKDLTAEQIAQLKASGDLSKEKAEQLVKEQQIASSQEKMNALTDKLSAIFAKVAGPILKILDPLMVLVDNVFPLIEAGINWAFAPILGIMDLFSGIGKIIDGDIIGGLKDIGSAIIEFFFAPFKFVWDTVMGFFPGLKASVDEIVDWIGDKIKGMLPDWAISLLGLDDDKSKEGGEEKAKEVHDAVISPQGGLEVSGPKGKFKLDENDTVVAGTDLGKPGISDSDRESSLMGQSARSNSVGSLVSQSTESSSSGILGSIAEGLSGAFDSVSDMVTGDSNKSNNAEVVSLLKELIAKVDQPVNINIGGRTIEEIGTQIGIRKSYSSRVDRGYGAA